MTLRFHPREVSFPLEIVIGETTSQDLLLDLGPPLRKFWKADERMKRMWDKTDSKDSKDCTPPQLKSTDDRLLELLSARSRLSRRRSGGYGQEDCGAFEHCTFPGTLVADLSPAHRCSNATLGAHGPFLRPQETAPVSPPITPSPLQAPSLH